MIYWLLSIVVAALAYGFGNLDSIVIASNFVFRKNLKKLGTGNAFISNFRRVYGWKGAVKLLLVELLLDLLPILIGGWLFGVKGYAVVGRALAGFCLVMGRMWPAIYELKGSHALFAMIVAAFGVDVSVGMGVLVVTAAVIALSRYVSAGMLGGAFVLLIAALLVLEERLATMLCIFIAVLIFVRHIPAISRMVNGKEEKLSFEEDIMYKFDEKF